VVLAAGRRIGPAEVGMLATVGQTRVKVYPKPRVAVLATGDEVVEPEEEPPVGYVRDSNRPAVIAVVIASGALIGLNNTLVTTAVMSISRVPRGVASATYGFVRFIGGGLAPYAAGKMVEHFNVHVPFLVGTCTVLAGAALLATVRPALDAADAAEAGADVEAGADGQPGPVPVAGPIRMAQAGQLVTVTSVPLTVTTAAGVDASRHRV